MRMKLERLAAEPRAHGGNQCPGTLRCQQSRRILEVQAWNVRGRGERAGEIGVESVVMHGADGVGQAREDLAAFLANDAGEIEERGQVMHRIDEREARDAVAHEAAIHEPHEVAPGRFPGDEAKAGRDELQRRIGRRGPHGADELPRIFLVSADGDAHVRAGVEIERGEADAIEHRRDAQRLGRIECGGAPETLVTVADGDIDELHGSDLGALCGCALAFTASGDRLTSLTVDSQFA